MKKTTIKSTIRAKITRDSLGGAYPAGSETIAHRVFKKYWDTLRGPALFQLADGRTILLRVQNADTDTFLYEPESSETKPNGLYKSHKLPYADVIAAWRVSTCVI